MQERGTAVAKPRAWDDGAHEPADVGAACGEEVLAFRLGARVRIDVPRAEDAVRRTEDDLRRLGRVLSGLARFDGIRVELGGLLRR